jgi:hypothetical protein
MGPGKSRVGRLRVAQLASLVDSLAGQAEVRDRRQSFTVWNTFRPARLRPGHFIPLLGGGVLIRQPALRLGFDLKGIGLSPVGDRTELWCGSASERKIGAIYARPTT